MAWLYAKFIPTLALITDSDYAAGVLQKIRHLCTIKGNIDSHNMYANFDLWVKMHKALVKWPIRKIE